MIKLNRTWAFRRLHKYFVLFWWSFSLWFLRCFLQFLRVVERKGLLIGFCSGLWQNDKEIRGKALNKIDIFNKKFIEFVWLSFEQIVPVSIRHDKTGKDVFCLQILVEGNNCWFSEFSRYFCFDFRLRVSFIFCE